MKLRKSPNRNIIKAANNFNPCDWSYMLEVEQAMLKNMFNYYLERNNSEIIKDLKLAINLLDIVLQSDATRISISGEWIFNNHYVNLRNSTRFLNYHYNNKTLQASDLRISKAFYLYNRLRTYKLLNWWL